MLGLQAHGRATAAAIAHTLQASGLTPATLAAAMGTLRASLTSSGGITLDEADALFAGTGFTPRAAYLAGLRTAFATSLQSVPFARDPLQAVATINRFVANETHGLVPLLFSGPLDPTTLLVLTDAVYLNAKWQTPFPHSGTAPGEFHLGNGTTVQVPFMNLARDAVSTERAAGVTALQLPYRGGRFAALILEPTTTSLTSFGRSSLSPARLATIVSGLKPEVEVGVAMPTVAISSGSSLNAPLTTLGMGIAFSTEADFSGIVANPKLSVTTVRQVATLKINEAGTVAAAATGIGLAPTAVAAPIGVVRIDQPFVVLIRDQQTDAVLFAATVADPALQTNK